MRRCVPPLSTVFTLLAGSVLSAPIRGQSLAGRFYPEKERYFVGEPVFIDFEITNYGDQPVWIDGRMGEPCIEPDQIEVVGAKYHGFGSDTSFGCFGGVGGSCASNDGELKPGDEHVGRIFLSARFSLDHARTYRVQARRRVPVSASAAPTLPPSTTTEFSSDFPITLVQGSDEELKAAFQPYIKGVNSPDALTQSEAIWAITETAPPFLEDVILRLADQPNRATAAIWGLRRLNTTRAKQKLAELAEHPRYDLLRQAAIQALAETRDRSYLPVLIRAARSSNDGDRVLAVQGAGLLGGDDAVPFLISMLLDSDTYVRVAAVRGLGLTASRPAVTTLIGALQDTETEVFQAAAISLAELTHYSITTAPWAEIPSADEYRRWHDWWLRNGLTAPIYTTDKCTEPQPLE